MVDNKPKVLVVVGPTASGKTGLAIELAKQFNGEVISADSRQVYKGLDIGTAKVTTEEMRGVPHHLLDIADPKDIYNAADFKRDAELVVADILKRGKLPIVAGGTFFYIDSLLSKIALPEVEPNPALRASLEEKSTAELMTLLESLDSQHASTIDNQNQRRLIRAIEVATKLGKVPIIESTELPYNSLTIGLTVDMENHSEVIKQRLIDRLDTGMLAEVEKLLAEGVSHERLSDLGLEYRYASQYLQQIIDYDTMVKEITTKSRQYAKRQLTWLKRDESIHWFNRKDEEIYGVVEDFLRK